MRLLIGTILIMTALAPAGQAQLIVGVDDTGINLLNNSPPGSNNYTPLFSGVQVWGLAYGNGVLHISSGSGYHQAALTGPAMSIGTFSADGGLNAQAIVGLAWANGQLYASDATNSAESPEGIYLVNTSTALTTLALAIPTAFDFGGFCFNPLNGLFYGTNDATGAPGGRGLFSIDVFGSGVITLVAAYPGAETDIDGLGIGPDGVAYLVTDQSGSFYSYDLSQGAGGTYQSFASPWTTSELFSGAAVIPEPSSVALGLLGAGMLGFFAARRRRR